MKTQYVVISGYEENKGVICIGIYDDIQKAYGRGYLYLMDKIWASNKEISWSISPRFNIDDVGYKFWIVKPENEEDDPSFEWIHILEVKQED